MNKGGFGNLMKQAQQLQSKMLKVQEEMAARTVEASAGGGMVTAVANGKQELVSIKIEKEVVNPEDVEMLQDLDRGRGQRRPEKRPGDGGRGDEKTDRRDQHPGDDVSRHVPPTRPAHIPLDSGADQASRNRGENRLPPGPAYPAHIPGERGGPGPGDLWKSRTKSASARNASTSRIRISAGSAGTRNGTRRSSASSAAPRT